MSRVIQLTHNNTLTMFEALKEKRANRIACDKFEALIKSDVFQAYNDKLEKFLKDFLVSNVAYIRELLKDKTNVTIIETNTDKLYEASIRIQAANGGGSFHLRISDKTGIVCNLYSPDTPPAFSAFIDCTPAEMERIYGTTFGLPGGGIIDMSEDYLVLKYLWNTEEYAITVYHMDTAAVGMSMVLRQLEYMLCSFGVELWFDHRTPNKQQVNLLA